ncbi:ASCH domain-containing protein [Candidatus Pacearchaeota archaeon]|nr:ASCH domain-containing protein [Candidatus Pacearchaeota archaeon]
MNEINRKMRALSVKQPWANLIASGRKTIETRKWKTDYRGKLLIVSSQKPDIYPAGYALAVVEIFNCRPMLTKDEQEACCNVYPNAFSWEFRKIRTIEPFPVKGRLGIFDVVMPDCFFNESATIDNSLCKISSIIQNISSRINFSRV